ncbi:MAG: hypothetical protein M0042_04540 [Nitrospiraceae bacterium]|nr:hypothetical protein [Nitrospiraceae bacterium]
MIKCSYTLLTVVVLFFTMAFSRSANASSTDAIETVGQGSINWTVGEVYATGIGAPPPNAVNAAQARAMAERAAMVVALRNLLEIVKGVRVDSETVVENFVTKSDVIRTRVAGIVRGAMPVKKNYFSDGSVEITVGMKLSGALMDAIVPGDFGRSASLPPLAPQPFKPSVPASKPLQPAPVPQVPEQRKEPAKPELLKREPQKPAVQQPSPAPPVKKTEPASPQPSAEPATAQFKGGKATGLIIDGRGLGLKPALLPKIVDPQGQEIYVGQVVTRTNAVEQGVAGYAKDVTAAANNFRVTDNPAVIRGIRASGAARTDIVLSAADSQILRDLGNKGDFLQFCRVIIVY